MTTWGTSYFVSEAAAVDYYRDYYGADARKAVKRKLRDGEIHIGRPDTKPGEQLIKMDDGKRYGIEESAS